MPELVSNCAVGELGKKRGAWRGGAVVVCPTLAMAGQVGEPARGEDDRLVATMKSMEIFMLRRNTIGISLGFAWICHAFYTPYLKSRTQVCEAA